MTTHNDYRFEQIILATVLRRLMIRLPLKDATQSTSASLRIYTRRYGESISPQTGKHWPQFVCVVSDGCLFLLKAELVSLWIAHNNPELIMFLNDVQLRGF
jgi:hypothetical protein